MRFVILFMLLFIMACASQQIPVSEELDELNETTVTGDCEKLTSSDKYYCLKDQMRLQKQIDCTGLTGDMRNLCVQEYNLRFANDSQCVSENEMENVSCNHAMRIQSEGIEYCDTKSAATHGGFGARESCYFSLSRIRNNPTYCLEAGHSRINCVTQLAIENENRALCDTLPGNEGQLCENWYVVTYDDLAQCMDLKDNHLCLTSLAIINQDFSLCSHAVNESLCRDVLLVAQNPFGPNLPLVNDYICGWNDNSLPGCARLVRSKEYPGIVPIEKIITEDALKLEDLSVCDKIQVGLASTLTARSAEQHRQQCYYDFGIKFKNSEACNKLAQGTIQRQNCLGSFATGSEHCTSNNCWLEQAAKTNDYVLCNNIQDFLQKSRCYQWISVKTKNISLCENGKYGVNTETGEQMGNSGCTILLALLAGESTVCNDKSWKDSCWGAFAEYEKDLTYCDKISNQLMRQNCHKNTSNTIEILCRSMDATPITECPSMFGISAEI